MVVAGDRVKAAVYLRVSSRDGRQDEANQEPDCLRLCEARGWEPVVFRERESGAKHRPAWEAVKEAARTGNVRAVVVWSVSRAGRKQAKLMADLAQLAHQYGAAVVSCTQRVVDIPSLETADRNPIMTIVRNQAIEWLALWAELERTEGIERTHAGLARARAKGKKLGRRFAIPQEAIDLAWELRSTIPQKGWMEIAARVAAAGHGRWTGRGIRNALERTPAGQVHRLEPKGSGTDGPKPGPHAGLRGRPPGGTN